MKTDVYIGLETHEFLQWPGYGQAWTSDVFTIIADLLQKQCNGAKRMDAGRWVSLEALQVGRSDVQAIEVVNQHSQLILPVIVHVEIDDLNLLGTDLSEQDLYPNMLLAKHQKFPCLKANTTFSAEQIVSFRPMRSAEVGLALSRKGGQDQHLKHWPDISKDTKGLVKRSDYQARSSAGMIPRTVSFFSPLPDSPRAGSSADAFGEHLSSRSQ